MMADEKMHAQIFHRRFVTSCSEMEISMLELAKEIVGGRRLTREEDCSFLLEADINELCEGADYIRKNLCGTRADLCAIINGKSGACSENCKFCSQSAHHHTACQAGDFIDEEAILSGCREAWEQGVDRYCIVTAGRAIKDEDFEKARGIGMSDTQLYKQAGNSIVVDVLIEIFKKLIFEDATYIKFLWK